MSINYAGLHLIGENYVTRPLSQQTYTNKMADAIHGAEAYIVPRKVDNTFKNMSLCVLNFNLHLFIFQVFFFLAITVLFEFLIMLYNVNK